MRKIRTFYYIIKQGVANSLKNWHMLLSSVFVIFVSLYIMGCLVLVSLNLQQTLTELEDRQRDIQINCSSEVSNEASLSIADIILNDSRVDTITDIITKEENLENAISYFEEDSALFQYHDAESMYVTIQVRLKSVVNIDNFITDMKRVAGVHDIVDNRSVYAFFSSIHTWVKVGSGAAVVVLGILSVILSANTIRLTVFARQKELRIMKNIGASRVYMRGPFAVEGIFIGLLSSAISYFAVRLTYSYIYGRVSGGSSVLSSLMTLTPFGDFSHTVLICFLAAGIVVGVISSAFAIRKYIRV